MKEYYSIGETAKLLGVTTQTLRFYDRIGLLHPCHIDPKNHYRYYRYQQFHLIDRIKYLQYFGISLKLIRDIIQKGQNNYLLEHLNASLAEVDRELEAVKKRKADLEWYIGYHTYMDSIHPNEKLYRVYLPERYIVEVPCYYKEELSNMEIKLAAVKARPEYKSESFHRQYGYILDVDSFFESEFYPRHYFTYLSAKPKLNENLYTVLPAGEYICMRTQLLYEKWDVNLLSAYFMDKRPQLVTALEFEDNLVDWADAWYEVQILL